MEKNRFVMEKAEGQYHLQLFFVTVFILAGVYLLFKILRGDRYFGSEEHRQDKLPFALISLLFGFVLLYLSPRVLEVAARITKYQAETFGVTTGLGKNCVNYKFTVNNKVYLSSASAQVDLGKDKVKVTGGRYKVVYNSRDPNESVIDFNTPEQEDN